LILRRASWVRKNDFSTNFADKADAMDTATNTANPVCQSPVISNTIKVVEIGAPKTDAATAAIPAMAYMLAPPDKCGKTDVAISPNAKPVNAPIINDGEKTPPPMRPPPW